MVMALAVIVMGAMRLRHPMELPTGPMLVAAAGGLVTEFVSLYLLHRQQGQDLNVRGAYWHIIRTFVGSLIIVVAALVIRFMGFLAIDPLLGIAFGFVLLWASWGILRDSVPLLMEGTPPGVDLAEATGALGRLDGGRDVHRVHAWALTSGRYVFSANLRTDSADAGADDVLLVRAHDLLRERFGFFFVTLQFETTCLDEAAAAEIDITSSVPSAWRISPLTEVNVRRSAAPQAGSSRRWSDR